MAILLLKQLWVNRLDTGEGITAPTSGRSQAWENALQVDTYASGRIAAVGTVGERGVADFTLLNLSLAQVATLRSWATVPVQVRDHRGQRWFGVFKGVSVIEWKPPLQYAAAITVETVTVVEGV